MTRLAGWALSLGRCGLRTATGGRAETALAKHKAKVEAAAREADYLRASSEELRALNPQEGEEKALAETRAKMMRAEKVAADLYEANDILSGTGSPMPSLASAVAAAGAQEERRRRNW